MNDLFQKTPAESAVSVSQLNRQAKQLLERSLTKLWVEGELSNIARPASGHVYFTLKDDAAQIRGAFFRQRQRGPTIGFKNGDRVLVFGRVSLYEARGDYQLIVEQIEAAGEGALKREFDRLKRKLAEEGLFDEDRKQPLPALPRRIGVVTSPSGAAVKDILSVLARRFPAIPVVIYPAAVQGDAAPGELITAIDSANQRAECDVLIVGRGGGSLEDLWAFNDEALARRIADSDIPIVSAVGHEVDFTIADFAADLRAPTPSGAAELVVPDSAEWLRNFEVFEHRLGRLGRRLLEEREQTLDWLERRLLQQSPEATLARQQQSLKDYGKRLRDLMHKRLLETRNALRRFETELARHSPALRIEQQNSRLTHIRDRLAVQIQTLLNDRRHRLSLGARALDGVSPLATLGRGYAIVSNVETGKVVRRAAELDPGNAIHARLGEGSITATVTQTDEE